MLQFFQQEVVQVKRPDAVFEKAFGITPSILKAYFDALLDDPTGEKLKKRTLELVKDAEEWKCAKRELNNKTFTMICMKSSEMSSTFSKEFGHFVQNSQFLCFSKSKRVTNSPFFTKLLELNDEIENDSEKINLLNFDKAQFVIFRAIASDGSIQPFIMCLGSFVYEMARSFHQDSNSYYKMRTVQHSINFTHDELKLVTTNDELFEYLTMYGIFSNHDLSDPTVYDDDYILHASDQDFQTYYRPINSLDDTTAMNGNCKNAVPGFGHNEMYPCFDSSVTYGLAVLGLNVSGILPLSLSTEGAVQEPDTRVGEPAVPFHGTVLIQNLTAGSSYVIYRYNGTDTLPLGPPFAKTKFQYATPFKATGESFTWKDPNTFMSNTATYYVAAPAE